MSARRLKSIACRSDPAGCRFGRSGRVRDHRQHGSGQTTRSASSPTTISAASSRTGIGVTTYTLGASLATDTAGSVAFYYFGKEAGYENIFSATNGAATLTYDTGFHAEQAELLRGNPISFRYRWTLRAGLLDFNFCAFSAPGVEPGCVTNAQNDRLNLGSLQSIAFSLSAAATAPGSSGTIRAPARTTTMTTC